MHFGLIEMLQHILRHRLRLNKLRRVIIFARELDYTSNNNEIVFCVHGSRQRGSEIPDRIAAKEVQDLCSMLCPASPNLPKSS